MRLATRLSALTRADVLALASLLLTTALLTLALGNLAVDDAFITYRYAVNLAQGQGFVYNPGQRALCTTAPLYALLLAPFAWGGLDVAAISNLIGAIGIGAGSVSIFALARRRGRTLLGWLAGMLYALQPLLWLSLGMETALGLALVLGAFAADDFGLPSWAGLFLGAAFVTRYDAALPAALLFWRRWLRDRRAALRLALAGLLGAAPVLLFLTLNFGSPLPATLTAKRAQALLGVTGFFSGTTFSEGLLTLARGWYELTPLYAPVGLMLAIGLISLPRRERWVRPYFFWAGAQLSAYILLGVAPYAWYYAPLIPALVWLTASGAEWVVKLFHSTPARRFAAIGVCILALAPFVISDAALWQAQTGALPDPTTDLSKVLPEAKVGSYRRAGEWLARNTPPTATVGATESGVIGFYARRALIDFLGLLQPDVTRAIARRDPSWALYAHQPDYLVLSAVNPIYSFDPRPDQWFQSAYRPVQRFDDPRFWGSPVVIYQRHAPYAGLPAGDSIPPNALPLHARFGESIELLAVEPSTRAIAPGEPLALRLWWRARSRVERDYAVSVQLLDREDLVAAQRDGQPGLGAHPISTWRPGQIVSDLALVGVPPTACAAAKAQLNITLYDPSTGQRLAVTAGDGRALGDSLRVDGFAVNAARRLDLSFARALTLTSYTVTPRGAKAGETFELALNWARAAAWHTGLSILVQLVSAEDGKMIAQAEGAPDLAHADRRRVRVPSAAPPGAYRFVVSVRRVGSGDRLPWLDAVGQPLGESLELCPVRVR